MSQKIGLVFFVLILINSCQNKYDSDIENQVNELIKLNEENLKIIGYNKYIFDDIKEQSYSEEWKKNIDIWKKRYEKINDNSKGFIEHIDFQIKVCETDENYKIDKSIIQKLYSTYIYKNNEIWKDSIIPSRIKEFIARDISKINYDDSIRFYKCFNLINENNSNNLVLLNLLKSYFLNSKTGYQSYILNTTPSKMRCLQYDKFAAVAAIDRSVVLKNQIIEISAGIGSFDDKSKPTISIQNKFIELTDGIATLKIKAPNKAGTYRIPVVIDFTTTSGEQKRETRMIEYKVVDTICK